MGILNCSHLFSSGCIYLTFDIFFSQPFHAISTRANKSFGHFSLAFMLKQIASDNGFQLNAASHTCVYKENCTKWSWKIVILEKFLKRNCIAFIFEQISFELC